MKKRPTREELEEMLNETLRRNQELLKKMDTTISASKKAQN